jgi:hypothetical protein
VRKKKMNTKLVTISLIVVALLGIGYVYASPYISTYIPTIPVVYAQDTTSDITNVVLQWMPLIILFAILGMILGMLKKLGKW